MASDSSSAGAYGNADLPLRNVTHIMNCRSQNPLKCSCNTSTAIRSNLMSCESQLSKFRPPSAVMREFVPINSLFVPYSGNACRYRNVHRKTISYLLTVKAEDYQSNGRANSFSVSDASLPLYFAIRTSVGDCTASFFHMQHKL